ncbi:MAG: response regulator [Opitutus sp.]|nr:response regulator [Opitutus sp.]
MSDLSPRLVMVVDDVPEITDFLENVVRTRGHSVIKARSGREAIAILRAVSVDVLITDILMPDGDGLELIQAARVRKPTPRIIAISGGGKYLASAQCLSLAGGFGADVVLRKPFDVDQLLAALEPGGATPSAVGPQAAPS